MKQAVRAMPAVVARLLQQLDRLPSEKARIIFAPYEADAQLAHMAHAGEIHLVYSTDSDLILYGRAPAVVTKWSKCDSSSALTVCHFDSAVAGMTLEQLRLYAVLTKHDYSPAGLPGVGPCTAMTLLNNVRVCVSVCILSVGATGGGWQRMYACGCVVFMRVA